MAEKKKDKNGEDYEVVAMATDFEIQTFLDLQARKDALNCAIKAALAGMADELEKVEKEFVKRWGRLAKKYNLDSEKRHQVDHPTREIRMKPKLWN